MKIKFQASISSPLAFFPISLGHFCTVPMHIFSLILHILVNDLLRGGFSIRHRYCNSPSHVFGVTEAIVTYLNVEFV
jgi:hypothetical protein